MYLFYIIYDIDILIYYLLNIHNYSQVLYYYKAILIYNY